MVDNPKTSLPSDLLQAADLPADKPITKIDDDQARTLLIETGPDSRRRRSGFYSGQHRAWYLYILQYMGFQAQETMEMLETADPRLLMADGAYIANHILRFVTGNVARKSVAKPDWDVTPNTPDQPDQDGAKVGNHLLAYAYDHLQVYDKSLDFNLWLETCGTAFWLNDWNFAAGGLRRIYKDPMRGTPIDPRDLPQEEKEFLDSMNSYVDVTDGDWEMTVLSPFQVFLPPHATRLEDADWVRYDIVYAYDEIWNRWPDKAKNIGPDDEWSQNGENYWRRLSTLSTRPGDMFTRSTGMGDGILVSYLHYRPSRRMPKGCTIIGTKTQMLENIPNRFHGMGLDEPHGLAMAKNIRVPGRLHGMGTVEHLVAPQREYNRARDQINRQRDSHGVPQWLSPKGSMKGAMRNELGDVWEYDAQFGVPQLVSPPPLAQAAIESAGMAVNDMQLIAAQSDPTQGQVPTGLRSGVAIRALQEKDQQVMGPSIGSLEQCYQRNGTLLLKLAWKNMKLPRAIAIYGETRQADVTWFKGSDLNGNTKVRVKQGSMMPRSRVETSSTIFDLIQMGALNPAMNPKDRRVVWKGLEVGGMEQAFLEEDGDRRRARVENNMYARPPADDPAFAFPDVDVDDDHAAHLEEHLIFKKTDEWERLPPIRKMLYNTHMEKHKMAIAEMIQAQMAMQQASAAGSGGGSEPKEPGEPSQPRERQPTPGTE